MNLLNQLSNVKPLRKVLGLPFKLVPGNTVMRIITGSLKGASWIKEAYVPDCWIGNYELEKVKIFEEYLQPGQVFWDIGSQAGYYSLIAAHHRLKEIYAFEPLPRNLDFLHRHVELNKANIKVFPFAIGKQDGEAYFDQNASVGSGHLTNQISGEKVIKVKVRSFTSLIQSGLEKPDIIKMDIEGAEQYVLPTILSALENQKPIIFLALHGVEVRESCLNTLQSHGYQVKTLAHDSRALEVDGLGEVLCLPNKL